MQAHSAQWKRGFHSAAIPLAKVLVATESRNELRRAVLYDNAARMLAN